MYLQHATYLPTYLIQVAQIAPSFFNLVDLASYPRIAAWLDRMAAQPYHEEVRTYPCPTPTLPLPYPYPHP